jgi:hypothetical protein
MKKSFGLIVLLVVMCVVFLLVSGAWQRIAPSALDLKAATTGSPDGSARERGTLDLPDLPEARQRTQAHKDQVQDTLAAGE